MMDQPKGIRCLMNRTLPHRATLTHPMSIAAVALTLSLGAGACGDDDASPDDVPSAASTTAKSTATSTATSITTSTDPAGSNGNTVIWPSPGAGETYEDPVAAASAFATAFVGFADPVVGVFQQGDSRSGEVEIRPTADGPVTTVLVRQVGAASSWSVIGAATASIQLTEPAALAELSSPVRLAGTSTAFEGTVQVQVRDQSSVEPLAEGFVTGGSMGVLGPFESTLEFLPPTTAAGSIVLFTVSMDDGRCGRHR